MASDPDKRKCSRQNHRSGQAMTEFVIVLLALILIIVALVELLPVFLENFGLLKEVREESGRRSLASESGMATADRKDEFSFEAPGILPGDRFTSGHFAEKLSLPAVNLACNGTVRIPNIAGLQETLHYENRDGASSFSSGLIALPPEQALARARGALTGAGWISHPIEAQDALVFSAAFTTTSAPQDGHLKVTIISSLGMISSAPSSTTLPWIFSTPPAALTFLPSKSE